MLRRAMPLLQYLGKYSLLTLSATCTAFAMTKNFKEEFPALLDGYLAMSSPLHLKQLVRRLYCLTALYRSGEQRFDGDADSLRSLVHAIDAVQIDASKALRQVGACACLFTLSSATDAKYRNCRCRSTVRPAAPSSAPASSVKISQTSRAKISQTSRADLEWEVQERRRIAKAARHHEEKYLHAAADASKGVALPPSAECNTFQLCMAKYLADRNAIIVRRPHVSHRLRMEEMKELKQHLRRETLAAFLYSGSRRRYEWWLARGFSGLLGSVRTAQRMIVAIDFPIGALHVAALRTAFISICVGILAGELFVEGKRGRGRTEVISAKLIHALRVRTAVAKHEMCMLNVDLAELVKRIEERGSKDAVEVDELAPAALLAGRAELEEARQYEERCREDSLPTLTGDAEVNAAAVKALREEEVEVYAETARLLQLRKAVTEPGASSSTESSSSSAASTSSRSSSSIPNDLFEKVCRVQRELEPGVPAYAQSLPVDKRLKLAGAIRESIAVLRRIPSEEAWPSPQRMFELMSEYTQCSIEGVKKLYSVFEVRDGVYVRNGSVMSTRTDEVIGLIRRGTGIMTGAYETHDGPAEEMEMYMVRAVHMDVTALVALLPLKKAMGWVPTWDCSRKLTLLLDEIGLTRVGLSCDAAIGNKHAEFHQRVPPPRPVSAPREHGGDEEDEDGAPNEVYDGTQPLPPPWGGIDEALVRKTMLQELSLAEAAKRRTAGTFLSYEYRSCILLSS